VFEREQSPLAVGNFVVTPDVVAPNTSGPSKNCVSRSAKNAALLLRAEVSV
jgi:hypothetical protein